jgi:site-specific DNA-methyltransferase (adenine-specific)
MSDIPHPVASRIIPGDCVNGMAQHLPDASVQLAFADPPFNIGYDYDIYNDRKSCDDYLDWSRQWMAQVHRALTPDGAFWLAIGDEYVAELKVIAHRDLGFHMRSWVVWYYTFGVHCTHKFTRSHAHLLHFVKDPKRFTFNIDDIRVPSARQLVYADKRSNPRGRTPDDTWILRPQQIPDAFEPESDTWYVPRVCGTYKERAGWHGCQMPEQILGRIVRACSNPGDLVLDPFAGSGTTLSVARKLGRRYLGFELSDEYREQATRRLDACHPGDPLEGSEPPPVTGTQPRPRQPKTVRQTVTEDPALF